MLVLDLETKQQLIPKKGPKQPLKQNVSVVSRRRVNVRPQAQARKNNPVRSRAIVRNPRPPKSTKVDKCASKYVVARLDPFNPHATGCCFFGETATAHLPYFTRGACEPVAAAGLHLGVVFFPCCSNNSPSIWEADSATTITLALAGGTCTAYGSPFVDASFGSHALEQRLVSAGVRITAIGAPLYRGGQMYGYWVPDSQMLAGTTTEANLWTFVNTRFATKSKKPLTLVFADQEKASYGNWHTSEYYGGVTGTPTTAPTFLYCQADASGTTAFLVETIAHWEVRGQTVSTMLTSPPSDATLFGKAWTGVESLLRQIGHDMPQPSVMARQLIGYLAPQVVNDVVNALSGSLSLESLSIMQ
jgi:hypothetical protein